MNADPLLKLTPLTILVAMAVQTRATEWVPIDSIMDEMAKYGLRMRFEDSLWRGLKALDVKAAMAPLQSMGFVSFQPESKRYRLNGAARSVHDLVQAIKGEFAVAQVQPEAAPRKITGKIMRDVLSKLAAITHPEIAEVLDEIRLNHIQSVQ